MATTYDAIGAVGTRNHGRYLGVALLVIATAQLMADLDGVAGADRADGGSTAGGG